MERETKTLTTPSKQTVVIKTYLTGREFRQIEQVFTSKAEIGADGQATGSFKGTLVQEAEDALITQAVVSVNGKSENCREALLDFPRADFQYVVKELNAMQYGGEGDSRKKEAS